MEVNELMNKARQLISASHELLDELVYTSGSNFRRNSLLLVLETLISTAIDLVEAHVLSLATEAFEESKIEVLRTLGELQLLVHELEQLSNQ